MNNQIAADPSWLTTHPTYLADGAAALAKEVAALQAAGARTIVVRNSNDSAIMAGPGGIIPVSNTAAYQRQVALGAAEWADLHAAGVNFIPADNDSLLSFVVKHPALFGFTPVSVQAINAPAANSTALIAILKPAQQQDYLFVDQLHLTTAGQTIEADYMYSLLIAPSQISMIAENAVQLGLGRAATIQRQIERFDQQRGPEGINVWVDAGVDSLKFKNASGFPDASGVPYGGTAGVDYLTPGGVVVGVALSAGGEIQRFATGGDFTLGKVTTGPVAGVVMQRVSVNGFTENGGVTALSFDRQPRDSVVSQLGWRVGADLAKWQPFAEATWNHEWADHDRMITTSLTSVEAPSYRMDAAPTATDWATGTIGTTYQINSQVTAHCVLVAQCFNAQAVTYGGNLGVTVSF